MATKNFIIKFEERLLKRIDTVIEKDMASRSEYFRRLALADLSRRETIEVILDAGNNKGSHLSLKMSQKS